MRFNKQLINAVLLITFLVVIATICICQRRYSSRDEVATNGKTKVHPLFKKWTICMKRESESFNEKESSITMNRCTRIVSNELKIESFQHLDEVKYHIFPIFSDSSTVVTIGVERDVHVEKMLWKALNNNVVFFGTDPFPDVNDKIYSFFGNFFPFAIGVDSGFSKTKVLDGIENREKLIIHMDFIYFLKNFVRNQLIDALWLQGENPDKRLLELFHRNGEFDKNGIVFCQINLELASINEEQRNRTVEFVHWILKEGRYSMLHMRTLSHTNMFLVNFEDFNCRKKYLPEMDE